MTLSYIDKDWKNWCLNCYGDQELSYGKVKTISGGKFSCPEESCKSLQDFESFIKGGCCETARVKQTLKKIKTDSTGRISNKTFIFQ